MSNTSKAAVFMLAGIAAGVTLGILFAPDKGKRNRQKLSGKLHDLGESLKETANSKFDSFMGFTDDLISDLTAKGSQYSRHDEDVEHAII